MSKCAFKSVAELEATITAYLSPKSIEPGRR
jgi:hypothetical protein